MPQNLSSRRLSAATPEGYVVMPKFKWERQLHAIQVDRAIKDVGFALARFAGTDGKNARPGVLRIMWASGIKDERTVHKGLARLRELGLIWLHQAGSGRPRAGKPARADHYWLTTHPAVSALVVDFEDWKKQRSGTEPSPWDAGFSPAENDPWAAGF